MIACLCVRVCSFLFHMIPAANRTERNQHKQITFLSSPLCSLFRAITFLFISKAQQAESLAKHLRPAGQPWLFGSDLDITRESVSRHDATRGSTHSKKWVKSARKVCAANPTKRANLRVWKSNFKSHK